jgi:transglutaminase-like putative cysteine protease
VKPTFTEISQHMVPENRPAVLSSTLVAKTQHVPVRYVAPAPTSPRSQFERIARGYRGTQTTVMRMRALIRAGAKDFYVRQHAIDILLAQAVRAKDYKGEIKALFEWVQQHVRYTKDPYAVEVLHTPRRMLELRAGDCDDMSMVLGALLESIGHPVRIVLTGSRPDRPRLFTHVYIEAFCRGRWIPLDATMPYPMGWEPRTPVKQVIRTGPGSHDGY